MERMQSYMKSALDGLAGMIECTLYQTEESEFGRKLESFLAAMGRLAPGKIHVVKASDLSGLPASPCFRIGNGMRAGIVYAALPEAHQLPPFLKALEWVACIGQLGCDPEPDVVSPPAELQVMISTDCPHCPKAVEAAAFLASRHPSIACHIIDAAQFPDICQRYGIKSVPATIVDRRLVLAGNTTADRLMELIQIRGTREYEMEVVLSLIEVRRISAAAECLAHETGRQVILALVQDADFSKRLSALVVIEKALEDNPGLVRSMAPAFAALLSNRDARIRGDVADLLGKIGDAQTIGKLEPLTSDPDADVAEIAAEAIAALRKNCDGRPV
jgi:thiol-disulfide isomerase/thioredoxin